MDGRAALEMRLAAVEEKIAKGRELVEQLEAAMDTDAPPSTDIEDLYREAGAPLPGLAERKRLCEALRARLRVQAEQVELRRELREQEREALERRLAQMRFALSPTDAAPPRSSSVVARP